MIDVTQIPILDVARRLGVGPTRGTARRCPFPNHEDKNPSFAFFPSTNSCWCFGCQRGGGVINLVALVEGMSPGQAAKWIADTYRLPSLHRRARFVLLPRRDLSIKTPKTDHFAPNSEVYEALLADTPLTQEANSYLASRGFGKQTISKFRLGFLRDSHESARKLIERFGATAVFRAGLLHHNKNHSTLTLQGPSILFPFFHDGLVVYMQSRLLPSATGARWMGLRGISRPLYNQDVIRHARTIHICEGASDVLAAAELGLDAVGVLGAGTRLSEAIIDNLRGKLVYIVPDLDEIGEQMAAQMSADLRKSGIQNIVKRITMGNDLNEYLLLSRRTS